MAFSSHGLALLTATPIVLGLILIILLIMLWRAHISRTCGCRKRRVEVLKAHPFTLTSPSDAPYSEMGTPREFEKGLSPSERSVEAMAGTLSTIPERSEQEENEGTNGTATMGMRTLTSHNRSTEEGRMSDPSSRATQGHHDLSDREFETALELEMEKRLTKRSSQDRFEGITHRLPESPQDGEHLPGYFPSPIATTTTAIGSTSSQSKPLTTNVTPIPSRTRSVLATFGDRLVAPRRRMPSVPSNPLGDMVSEFFPSPIVTVQPNFPPIVLSPLPPVPVSPHPTRSTRAIRPLPPLPIPLVPVRPPAGESETSTAPPPLTQSRTREPPAPLDLPPPYARHFVLTMR